MDTIEVSLNINAECSENNEPFSQFPTKTSIYVSHEYNDGAPWGAVLGNLVKGLEAFYGYSFSKEKLHEFADKYGS